MALEVGGSSPLGHPTCVKVLHVWDNIAVGPAGAFRKLIDPAQGRIAAPLAQWQSNGLLIRRFWVRIPGGAPSSDSLDSTALPLGSPYRAIFGRSLLAATSTRVIPAWTASPTIAALRIESCVARLVKRLPSPATPIANAVC